MSKRRTLQLFQGMTKTVIATILTAALTGWLMFNGDTVGSASSAATRASRPAGQQIGGTGGGTAHNNMQPSMALNWIVKA